MGRLGSVLEHSATDDVSVAQRIREVAHPLTTRDLRAYGPLMELVGDARIVLIGEARHGTHEFYRERALITTRLIRGFGFSFVAVEGDWPECNEVNRYTRGDAGSATGAAPGSVHRGRLR